jgi:glucokinase
MKEVAIGIDIGGTNTAIGIVDRDGHCLVETSIPTDTHDDVTKYVADVSKKIQDIIAFSEGALDIKGIGIGAPNANYHKGTIENAPNLRWKGIIKFSELFQSHFPGITVALTNDANAAAMGEMMYGGAKGMKDFIVITLGTGLGSGVVSNGELVYGHDGFAGEIGHTIAVYNGRMCGCGRKGCLETYASATGVKRSIFQLMCDSNKPSSLRDIPFSKMTSSDVYKAAVVGDELALDCFDYTGKILGEKMADTVAHTSPEAIFLFGGMAKSGDLIINPTKKYMEEAMLPIFKNKVKILPSALGDVNAAVLGASALVWNELGK